MPLLLWIMLFAAFGGIASAAFAVVFLWVPEEQSARILVVRFDLAGARFTPDRSHVIFPVRALEYDGKTFSAAEQGTVLAVELAQPGQLLGQVSAAAERRQDPHRPGR